MLKQALKILTFFLVGLTHILVSASETKPALAHSARILSRAAAVQKHGYKASQQQSSLREQMPQRVTMSYTPVEFVHTLHEERIDKDITYGVYMIENVRGGNNRRAYPCQDRAFAGTLVGLALFGAFDGHGEKGDVLAADMATRFPLEVFKQRKVEDGIKIACKRFQEQYARMHEAQESGTTLVCGALRGNQLTVGNVGDSRLIVIRPSKQSIPFSTVDHKGKPGRMLALSRSLGDVSMHKLYGLNAQPDVTTLSLVENDVIIIASDGFWDAMSNDETYDSVIGMLNMDCKSMAKALAEKARERQSKDDITVICVRYKKQ